MSRLFVSKSPWIPPWKLVSTLILLIGFGSCRFDRGERYWSGRPQPIGIDFSHSRVIGVYADGPDNFTTLGSVTSVSNSQKRYDYASYIYAFYYRRLNGGNEFPFVAHEPMPEPWYWGVLSKGMSWMNDIGESACNNMPPILRMIHDNICFPEESDVPRKPQSKYRNLLAKLRNERLQARIPKRFQAPRQSEKPLALTRDDFVMVLLELLEELKRVSVADHNITITSATISRPSWVSDEVNDLFDEACLLADIEVLEQPHSRVDMSTKDVTLGKSVLVIDHGYYHLHITRQVWNEENRAFQDESSSGERGDGLVQMLLPLSVRILNAWKSTNYTCSAETGGMNWVGDMGEVKIITQVQESRMRLKYLSGLVQDVEFRNASTTVNLTDSTGYSRILNMTGQDVLDAEEDYVKKVSETIKSGQTDWDSVHALSESDEHRHLISSEASPFYQNFPTNALGILQNIPPPAHLGSWQKSVDSVVILDNNWDEHLLRRAAEMAFGWNETAEDDGICVPSVLLAARGAALRAREWGVYYEGWKREMYFFDRWSREEAYEQSCEDDGGECDEDDEL